MVYNLIPSSHDIPKDGNCLFHSIAIGVGELDNVQYRQEDIRMAVVAYLRSNPTLPNGEALVDFVPNRNWEDYLDGLAGDEWGDHISIVAISNIYNVQINIVSSQDTRLQEILPYVSNMAQDRNIYLGHEFEVHYILLENLVSQDYQNDSVNSGNDLLSTNSNTFFSVKNSSGDDASDFCNENESVNKQDACSHISIEKESDSENQADSNDDRESPDFNENNNISTDIENNFNDEKDDSGNIHCDVPMQEKRPKRKIIPPSRYSPCQLQNVAQRNKRNTRMLYTRASMFTLFTKLPREIQLKILFLLIGSSAACIGILNRVCTHFRQMIIGSINQLPKIYINSGTMTRLTNKVTNEMSTEFDGRIYEFSLRSLCMASGRSSGLMISIKDIFRGYTKWFSGYITVRSSDTPGWFYITDFYLKHDDDYFY
ncbi:unnamed protein product [Mytilus edulis]|uniref:OTU domain-containing protein n=1 Tax=Mytilus edulis TaxID=6550 RepID=A0A8S3RYJ1_MYTED|nr:unnamed protein product [Mytilus edulis]